MEEVVDTILKELNKKTKIVVMLAPSFVAEFSFPDIVIHLKNAGFDKVVELTFGAKIVNKEYHKLLSCSGKDCFWISSVCPGIVSFVQNNFPQYKKNIIPVVSPMIATARLCRKIYPKHKIIFISPCNMKKIEAKNNPQDIDYVLDYQELRSLFKPLNINPDKKTISRINKPIHFDKFYNDYTKIYPLAGGLSKTANLKGIVGANDTEIIDGIALVKHFLDKPDKSIRFLDANFCVGGCIGGPCFSSKISLDVKKKRVLNYVKKAMREKICKEDKGILKQAKDINLFAEYH